MKIDECSLANLLRSVRAATIIGLCAWTVPPMRKKGNPYFGQIIKLCRLTAVIGATYGSAVNRRRTKEASLAGRKSVDHFASAHRHWGNHVRTPGPNGRAVSVRPRCRVRRRRTPLIEHKGRLYLHLQRQQLLQVEFRHTETGQPIDAKQIEPWLRAPTGESRRQKLTRPVIVRDYALNSIVQIRMRGQVYEIIKTKRPHF